MMTETEFYLQPKYLSFMQVFLHSSVTVSEMDETKFKTTVTRRNPDTTDLSCPSFLCEGCAVPEGDCL